MAYDFDEPCPAQKRLAEVQNTLHELRSDVSEQTWFGDSADLEEHELVPVQVSASDLGRMPPQVLAEALQEISAELGMVDSDVED